MGIVMIIFNRSYYGIIEEIELKEVFRKKKFFIRVSKVK